MDRINRLIPMQALIFFIAIMLGFTGPILAQTGLTPTQVSQLKSVGISFT